MTVEDWVGRNVVLWPSDERPRHVHVLGADSHGWTFEVLASGHTGTKVGYRAGDQVFISHAAPVQLADLGELN